MANYDSNKEAHQLTIVDSTITQTSLIPCQDVVSNPLGVATPPAIVSQSTIDDIQDGVTSKKILATTKTGYDNHLLNVANPHTVTKAQVGLGNCDNTSDLNKPVSTATTAAIKVHTDLTTNPHSVTKAQVGLSVVDNTTDAGKPISIAGLAANAAINANIDIIEQDVLDIETILNTSSLVSTSVTSVLMAINVNKTFVLATDLQYIPGTAVVAIYNTDRTKWMHGYVVSYTAGTKTLVIKPTKMNGTGTYASWSIAQSSQAYETITGLIAVHTALVNNPHTVTKAQVGLGNADNTSDLNKPVSTATTAAIKVHTDLTTNPHVVTKAQVGLGNCDNTSDLNKPVSTATTAAISAHANRVDNPHVVTKTQVGLSNVDNTTDLLKPISTATQSALTAITNNIDVIEQDVIDIESILTTSSLVSTSVSSIAIAPGVSRSFVLVTNMQYIPGTAVVIIYNSDITKWMHGYVISYTSGTKTLVVQITLTSGTGTYTNWSIAQSSQRYATITAAVTAHSSLTTNPHAVTKTQVGLSNVDNTTDLLKPISTATQSALTAITNNIDVIEQDVIDIESILTTSSLDSTKFMRTDTNTTTTGILTAAALRTGSYEMVHNLVTGALDFNFLG